MLGQSIDYLRIRIYKRIIRIFCHYGIDHIIHDSEIMNFINDRLNQILPYFIIDDYINEKDIKQKYLSIFTIFETEALHKWEYLFSEPPFESKIYRDYHQYEEDEQDRIKGIMKQTLLNEDKDYHGFRIGIDEDQEMIL